MWVEKTFQLLAPLCITQFTNELYIGGDDKKCMATRWREVGLVNQIPHTHTHTHAYTRGRAVSLVGGVDIENLSLVVQWNRLFNL